MFGASVAFSPGGDVLLRHALDVTFNISSADGSRWATGKGSFAASYDADGFRWDAGAEAFFGPLSTALYYGRPHASSEDAFKLVHSSARSDASVAAVLRRRGRTEATLQFVSDVPLRRAFGPLVYGRLRGPGGTGLSVVAYGSERVQHRFASLDGRLSIGGRPLEWGVAWMEGAEVDRAGRRAPVSDGAAFLRGEWRRGAHAGWWRLHGTGAEFRSLVADAYPFVRGKLGLEGRWQWRVKTGSLISIFGRRTEPVAAEAGEGAEYEAEMSVSSMLRGRWGWRLGADLEGTGGSWRFPAFHLSSADPSRRWEWSVQASLRDGSPPALRYRMQWEPGSWRVRLLLDRVYGGWRVEGRGGNDGPWGWTVVYKGRDEVKGSPTRWLHVEIRRRLLEGSEAWVQFMEPDLGRIDVGWNRPTVVVIGVRMSF